MLVPLGLIDEARKASRQTVKLTRDLGAGGNLAAILWAVSALHCLIADSDTANKFAHEALSLTQPQWSCSSRSPSRKRRSTLSKH